MDFGNGWQLTPDQWRQLHVLEWLYDHADGRPEQFVTTNHAELACALPGILPASSGLPRVTFDYLYREELIRYPIPCPGVVADVPARAELTEAGASLIRQLRRRRADPAERRPAARSAVLRWLYEQAAAGTPSPMLWSFSEGSYARFLSAATFFTIAEVNDAARWLHQGGYIAGAIDKPTITPDGERAVESGYPASGDTAAPESTTFARAGEHGRTQRRHPGGTVPGQYIDAQVVAAIRTADGTDRFNRSKLLRLVGELNAGHGQ